jgi:hypothetical protein
MPLADHERLSAALTSLRWGSNTFAGAARIAERTARRMLIGAVRIPPPILTWVEVLAAHHNQHPPPIDPKRET